jgi:hypothetical protein
MVQMAILEVDAEVLYHKLEVYSNTMIHSCKEGHKCVITIPITTNTMCLVTVVKHIKSYVDYED